MEVEKIESNWESFCNLVEQNSGDRKDALMSMVDTLGERLATCPATIKDEPGSLVDFNLRVLKACMTLNKRFDLGLDTDSIVLACLFRNLGLVGDLQNDLMVPADAWQIKRGQNFKYADDLTFMKTFDRTMFWMSHFGVKLTQDEIMAILCGSGNNDHYKFGEPPLAFAVYSAVRFVGFQQDKDSNEE